MNERTIIRLFPNASRGLLKANGCLRFTEPQPEPGPALVEALPRETESLGRVVVRFTCFRVGLLDADNLAGSIKDLLDGLRHAHLIRDDSTKEIKLEVEQERVNRREYERTEIELIYP